MLGSKSLSHGRGEEKRLFRSILRGGVKGEKVGKNKEGLAMPGNQGAMTRR